MSAARIAIYGLGRAGQSLASSLQTAGIQPTLLYNRDAQRAALAEHALQNAVYTGSIPEAADADLIILAVSDSAITGVLDQILEAGPIAGHAVIAHLSGALSPGLLHRGSRRDWFAGALHPLRSLTGIATAWQGCFCGIGGEDQAVERLKEIAGILGCRCAVIDDGSRALYHAAASMAANDLLALVEASRQAFVLAGLSDEHALRCSTDLSQGVLANAARLGPAAALTGPLRRGDVEVLRAQDRALKKQFPGARELHLACSRFLLDMPDDAGGSDEIKNAVRAFLARA